MNFFVRGGVALLLAWPASQCFAGNSVDQRDPVVVADLASIKNALTSIQDAQYFIEKLSGGESLPGLDKDAMNARLIELEQFLTFVLSPERKRFEHKVLTSRSSLFKPVNYKELHYENP